MTIGWALTGQAATLVAIAVVFLAALYRKAARVDHGLSDGKPLAQKNYDHDSEALGFAVNHPANRLTLNSRQVS